MTRSIVALIPCYNVERYCELVIGETSLACTHVIVVDDGSTDATYSILQRLSQRHPKNIHMIQFEKNRGKGFALLEGFKYAARHLTFDALITLDGDGQHFSHFVPHLAEEVFKGADLVIGGRPFALMPLKNRFANQLISRLLRFIYPQAPLDTQSGMRGFSPRMIKRFVQTIKGGRYEMEFRCLLLALKEQYRIKEVEIPTIYLDKNKSSHFAPWVDSMRILGVLAAHVAGFR